MDEFLVVECCLPVWLLFCLQQLQEFFLLPAKMTDVQLPEPFASIPRESFLFGPSPIQYLPRISEALGGKVQVYAKREDCNSGLAYGGNKTRKLE